MDFNKIFLIPLILSIGITPALSFDFAPDANAESTEICINKVWVENSKGKIACVTSSTADILVERGWKTLTDNQTSESSTSMNNMEGAPFSSISVMAFGPENTLFIGDSMGSQIVAIELGSATPPPSTESKSYNLYNIGADIADYFGVSESDIKVTDLKVSPQSGIVYLSVHVGFSQEKVPHIITVDVEGNLNEINYSAYANSSMKLTDTKNDGVTFGDGKTNQRTFTISDIDYHKGNIYVAGLSNEDFASSLKTLQYPFDGKYKTTNTEMYHTTHNQMETRAPIRTQAILELNGVDTLFAGYTCTPMVTIPIDSLADGALVSAKTIVEIGYANSPIDVLPFTAPANVRDRGPDAVMVDFILVTNTHKGASLFKVSDIADYDKRVGLTTPVSFGDVAGVEFRHVPMVGLLHVDEQDKQNILGLKRDLQSGELDLLSIPKGMYFRSGDFMADINSPPPPQPVNGDMKDKNKNQL